MLEQTSTNMMRYELLYVLTYYVYLPIMHYAMQGHIQNFREGVLFTTAILANNILTNHTSFPGKLPENDTKYWRTGIFKYIPVSKHT